MSNVNTIALFALVITDAECECNINSFNVAMDDMLNEQLVNTPAMSKMEAAIAAAEAEADALFQAREDMSTMVSMFN